MPKHQELQPVAVFEGELERAARRMGLAGRGVLAAVSGGADSLTLLHGLAAVAARLGLRLEVATVDHGLAEESRAWADGVVRACAGLGVRCHRVALHLDCATAGLEAVARDARYAALERVRLEAGLDVIATAHTASDQAETLLMRLARGAALGGAGGILEARGDRVVRPLLFATRADVETYVAALGLSPVIDPMNGDPTFLRTRVRREVVPALSAAVGYDAQPALARFARLAEEDDALLREEARRAFDRLAWPDGTLDRVGVAALSAPIGRRVVALVLERAGLPLDARAIDDGLRAIVEAGTATLPADRLLTCANDRVRVEPAPPRRSS